MIEDRAYQIRAIEKLVEYAVEHPAGGSILLSCPPGGGKTVIVSVALRLLVAEQNLRGLALAHRREIVFQIYDHLIDCGVPREMLGIIVHGDAGYEHDDDAQPARRVDRLAPIQVGTVGMIQKLRPPADVIWWDEAHLDAADGRRGLRAVYPKAVHIGSTGSPCRLDGRGLRREYNTFLRVSSVTELITLGYLADPIVYTVPEKLLPDLRRVRKKRGDYDVEELGKVASRRAIVGGIVEHWKRHAEGRRTFAFAVTTEHSRHIARAFREAGIPWEHVDSRTKPNARRRLLDRVTSGNLMGLSCCDLLTAGVDRPPIKCVIQARPTLSLVMHLQQTGRCMRPWDGVRPIILDHAGNNMRPGLGLPQEERDWESIFTNDVHGGQVQRPTAKVCSQCHAIMPLSFGACIECETPFPTLKIDPLAPEKDGELAIAKASAEAREAAWQTILGVARDVGADDQWASKIFATRFGVTPPRSQEAA